MAVVVVVVVATSMRHCYYFVMVIVTAHFGLIDVVNVALPGPAVAIVTIVVVVAEDIQNVNFNIFKNIQKPSKQCFI